MITLKSDMSYEELQDKLDSMNLESSLEATLKSLGGSANIEESKKLKESWYRGCEDDVVLTVPGSMR